MTNYSQIQAYLADLTDPIREKDPDLFSFIEQAIEDSFNKALKPIKPSSKAFFSDKEDPFYSNPSLPQPPQRDIKSFILNLKKNTKEMLLKKGRIQKKIALEAEKTEKMLKEVEEAHKIEKKKEVEQRMKESKEKQDNLRAKLLIKEAEYKDYQSKFPVQNLHQKMEKGYIKQRKEEFMVREGKLLEIKESHKPFTNRELLNFEGKFSLILQEKEKLRNEKNLKLKAFLQDREAEIKERFGSNLFKKMETLRKEEQKKDLLKENKALIHKEFFEEVKKKHKPKIDRCKVLELEVLKQEIPYFRYNLSEGNIEEGDKLDRYELGITYLRSLNQNKKKKKKNKGKTIEKEVINPIENDLIPNENLLENISYKEPNTLIKNNPLERPNNQLYTFSEGPSLEKPNNYLHEISERYKLTKKPDYWKKIDKIKGLTPIEKLEKLRQEAALMEKKAKMKEEILKLSRKRRKFDPILEAQNQDIEELLLNSIQAKLKLLEK